MLEEEGMIDKIKTTWRIPKELIKKFKHLATDRETNVTTLVIEAMKEYLEKEKHKR
jgi:predicted transcriptional regulator